MIDAYLFYESIANTILGHNNRSYALYHLKVISSAKLFFHFYPFYGRSCLVNEGFPFLCEYVLSKDYLNKEFLIRIFLKGKFMVCWFKIYIMRGKFLRWNLKISKDPHICSLECVWVWYGQKAVKGVEVPPPTGYGTANRQNRRVAKYSM